MLVLSYKCGQLGNRLFASAHIIAAAEANGLRVINLSLDEYARFFKGTSDDLFCRYPKTKSYINSNLLRSWLFIFNKAVLKLLRICKIESGPGYAVVVADLPEFQFDESRFFDMQNSQFLKKAKSKTVLLFGRFFRDYSNMNIHQDAIRKYFTPINAINSKIDTFVKNVKGKSELLVGVHIRRGDYEQFAEGRYFFSQSDYNAKMKELQQGVGKRNIKFIICSNEAIDATCFEGVDTALGQGNAVEDMYLLARCDYIMGPPSTFTLWAAFYGKKPLYQIRNIHDPIGLSCFRYLPSEILFNFSFN